MYHKPLLSTLAAVLTAHLSLAQLNNIKIQFSDCDQRKIEIEKKKETVVPFEISTEKDDSGKVSAKLEISVNDNAATTLKSEQVKTIEFRSSSKTVTLKKGDQSHYFYLVIPEDIKDFHDKVLSVTGKITVGASSQQFNCQITLVKALDLPYVLDDYINDRQLKLDYVVSVQSNANVLTLSGYKDEQFAKRNVALEKNEVLAIKEWTPISISKKKLRWSGSHFKPLPISLITIPFKVRPALKADGNEFKTTSTSGLSNIGFNIELIKYQLDRYFATARKSTHRWSVGFSATPSVEELDSKTAPDALAGEEKSKQLFISTAFTIAYSYNDISFVFAPAGWDMATSSLGRKWVYEGERWWGFGIAVSPKIFSTILNK